MMSSSWKFHILSAIFVLVKNHVLKFLCLPIGIMFSDFWASWKIVGTCNFTLNLAKFYSLEWLHWCYLRTTFTIYHWVQIVYGYFVTRGPRSKILIPDWNQTWNQLVGLWIEDQNKNLKKQLFLVLLTDHTLKFELLNTTSITGLYVLTFMCYCYAEKMTIQTHYPAFLRFAAYLFEILVVLMIDPLQIELFFWLKLCLIYFGVFSHPLS